MLSDAGLAVDNRGILPETSFRRSCNIRGFQQHVKNYRNADIVCIDQPIRAYDLYSLYSLYDLSY